MWILGKADRDLCFLLFPGALAFLAVLALPPTSPLAPLVAFLALGLVDSGHGFTTIWRTYLHAPERKRSSVYWILPLALLAVVTPWVYFQWPYLWTAVIGLSVYHFLRQYVGVLKWYEKLNENPCRYSKAFLYGLCLIPIALSTLRSSNPLMEDGFYGGESVSTLAPSSPLLVIGLWVYFGFGVAWTIFEARRWREGRREPNRLLAIASPALIYGLCFLVGRTYGEMLFPLLIAHGVPYFVLMGLGLERTQRTRFPRFRGALAVILLTALAYGGFEYFVAEGLWGLDEDSPLGQPPSLVHSFLVAGYLLPTLCHYFFDGIIWRGNHWEARAIYQRPTPSTASSQAA